MAASGKARALPGRYAKFLTAVAGNALLYADVTYGTTNRWVQLATAAAVALGVLAVPNVPAAPATPPCRCSRADPPDPPMQSLPPTAADMNAPPPSVPELLAPPAGPVAFAQNTSSGTATIVHAASWMTAQRVS